MKKFIILLGIIFAGFFIMPANAEELILIPNVVNEETVDVVETMSVTEQTIYDVYSNTELDMLFRVVEAETYGWYYENHRNVANVIFNRVRTGWGSLTKVLTAPYQFEVVTTGFYKKVVVSVDTIRAVEDAFKHDYTGGALYFDSTNGKSYAAKHCKFLFRDSCGHDFYKEK